MKSKFYSVIVIMVISVSLFAQKKVSDVITTGNENYAILNISRSYTYQEMRGSAKLLQEVYINDQPVCKIECQSRVSIKIFSEGKMNITVKFLPDKKYTQKIIDKYFLSGPPLEIDIIHGKTYFSNIDLKVKEGALRVSWTGKLVTIPESEGMYKDEERFKKFPEINEFQEDGNNVFIKK